MHCEALKSMCEVCMVSNQHTVRPHHQQVSSQADHAWNPTLLLAVVVRLSWFVIYISSLAWMPSMTAEIRSNDVTNLRSVEQGLRSAYLQMRKRGLWDGVMRNVREWDKDRDYDHFIVFSLGLGGKEGGYTRHVSYLSWS